ncbi:MAG: hypothetical protein E7378_01325 [Clostridiales bacterium]|nr:hypothetical protein [Clostridiales bacterium]
MYTVEQLEQQIGSYGESSKRLPRSKKATVVLNGALNHLDLCVLSNVMVGLVGPHVYTTKEDKPFRIKKFKAHIEELAKDPNARIMLGGDLFYFPGGSKNYRAIYSPNYEEQVELLAELLMPIKDKIIGAYDGTEEGRIFEKDGINATKLLMERLGLADRYFGQMAEVEFVFRNEYTGNNPKSVKVLFDHGFLAAGTTGTIAAKTEGLQKKLSGKDFYFTSHYNKMFIERAAVLEQDGARMIKKPCYFVSVAGYRDFPARLSSNRNTAPANTDNGVIRIFVAPNPDRHNIRGNDYLGEPTYKICQEFINFGTLMSEHLDYDLCEEISRLNEQNLLNKELLIYLISQKIDTISKDNIETLLTKYYGESDALERKKAKKVKKAAKVAEEKVIIRE